MKRSILLLSGLLNLLFVLCFTGFGHTAITPTTKAIRASQIPFIANQGQFDEKVRYYAKTFGGTVFITDEGQWIYSLPGKGRTTSDLNRSFRSQHHAKKNDSFTKEVAKGLALKEELIGAKFAGVKGEGVASAKVNYFKGNDENKWKTNITTYDFVNLGEVYEGIELKMEAHGDNVEKLFTVKPGAQPEAIKVTLSGAKSLKVVETGELAVETDLGTVKFTKPVAWQEINGKRVEIAASYLLADSKEVLSTAGNVYGFKLGAYDKTREVLIDPLLYSTFLGGSSSDLGLAIKVDSVGNIYVAGVTMSSNFPTTVGIFDTTFNGGNTDFFISKIGPAGNLVYSTFIGGSSDDYDSNEYDSLYTSGMTTDLAGNVYMTGETYSTDFPTTGGAYDRIFNGGSDVFVLKLNNLGNALVYSTLIGGSNYDESVGIAVDTLESAYIAGTTFSSNFPTTAGAFSTSFNGGTTDWFAVKLNPAGSDLVYSTYIGGSTGPGCVSCYEDAGNIVIDSAGNAYIAGGGEAADFPTTTGAYDRTYNGHYDGYLIKLNSAGSGLLAATYFGGTGGEFVQGLAIDNNGNVFISGDVESTDLPMTNGAYDSTYDGIGLEGFIAKFDANLNNLMASTYFKGFTPAITTDASGNVYVAGMAMSSAFPVTPGAFDTTFDGGVSNGGALIDDICSPGGCDAFVSKFDNNLMNLLASTFIGGSGNEVVVDMALNPAGNVYITGITTSIDFTDVNGFDSSHNGSEDVFVAVLDPNLSSDPFSDVPPGFWAYDYIMAIYNAGITTGYPDGTYRPSENVSRSQMASFIIRALFGEDFSYSPTQHFTDIPDTHWAFKYIQKMYDEGITTGYSDGTYRPSQNVTRGQMASFIIRALFGEDFSYSSTQHFTDIPDTHWAFKYIQKMYDEGITTGYSDGTYRPSQNVSRAQMATFIARAFLGMNPLSLYLDPSNLPACSVNTPYYQSVVMTATGGVPPYVFSCVGSGVPGLSVSSNGNTCTISGTPTYTGTYNVTYSVTDSANPAGFAQVTADITVSTCADPAHVHLAYNTAYDDYIIEAGATKFFEATLSTPCNTTAKELRFSLTMLDQANHDMLVKKSYDMSLCWPTLSDYTTRLSQTGYDNPNAPFTDGFYFWNFIGSLGGETVIVEQTYAQYPGFYQDDTYYILVHNTDSVNRTFYIRYYCF
jgi:hypothetical protein